MRWTAWVCVVLVMSGCDLENGFLRKDDNVGPPDTGDTDPPIWDTSDPNPDPEICNGEDDDGDGEIDEGYDDHDGDGLADCVDDDCDVNEPTATTVEVNEECEGSGVVVSDPWNVGIEWQWTALSTNASVNQSVIPPLVANLTDTDGDLDVDLDDVPNVVVVALASSSFGNGELVVLDGATGAEVWSQPNVSGFGGHAIADATGDGSPDIALFNGSNNPVLYSADGTLLWTATVSSSISLFAFPQAHIADLDGDGAAEVIAGTYILDGATGALNASLSVSASIPYTMATVGDIDLDGEQEVILGNTVYGPTGTVEWSVSQTGTYGHWSAIINADTDPEGEVAMVGAGRLNIYDHDGSTLYSSAAGGTGASPPCAADFDGDGDTDIAWASQGTFHAYDLTGTALWTQVVNDASGLAGCSAYDVNGDGAYEVLYADEQSFFIMDGATGTKLYTQTDHASGTLFEYPTVADVDNDGSAEILYVSNSYSTGMVAAVTVLGHSGDGWAKSGPTWPFHDFAVSNVNPDATLPSTIPYYWQDYNVYRARPIVDEITVDLEVAIADVCYAGCMETSPVKITAQVFNTGGEDSVPDIPITLYAMNGGVETAIETRTLPGTIASGTGTASILFELTAGTVAPDGFRVRVDDDGTGGTVQLECLEENNVADWTDVPC